MKIHSVNVTREVSPERNYKEIYHFTWWEDDQQYHATVHKKIQSVLDFAELPFWQKIKLLFRR